ncbi:MAG: tetratricopeptide repeat protein [Verrucomicrobiota bacterium]
MATARSVKFLSLGVLLLHTVALGCGPFFYEAPQSLDHYPERLPVKTLRELLKETQPRPAGAATFDELAAETRAIANDIAKVAPPLLLERIELALARNRAGDYRKRFANCLYDLRDLLGSTNPAGAELHEYAAMRVEAMEWDDGFFQKAPSGEPWNITAKELEKKRRVWEQGRDETAARFMAGMAKASAAFKLHWLVLAGAWQFRHTNFEEAERLFIEVMTGSPQHPRAEVARLMLARIKMEQWRSDAPQPMGHSLPPAEWKAYRAAQDALDAYLKAHPNGRFAPDIPGWKGGLAREAGHLNEAMTCFLEQMDLRDHPEVVRRAVHEFERCLGELDSRTLEDEIGWNDGGRALPLAEIARRPLAALALVYHFLDAESRRDFGDLLERVDSLNERDITRGKLPSVLRMRRAGRAILPFLARAVANEKANYGGLVWRPKYLAILAWSASESGDQEQAIRLCEMAGETREQSDDLLFAQGVALQRNGRLNEAIAVFRQLQAKFPQSPLTGDTRFRIATALRDNHEAGLAVVEFHRIQASQKRNHDTPPRSSVAPDLHLPGELDQWIGTLLQFSPLPEIARGLSAPGIEPEIATALRQILRERHVAREDFTEALRFSESPVPSLPTEEKETRWRKLTGEEWINTVRRLNDLKMEIGAAVTREERGKKCLALAGKWSALHTMLTFPEQEQFHHSHNQFEESRAHWFQNARVAGISMDDAAREWEQRNELHHAFHYYLKAADQLPGTGLAARALWLANASLRRGAEVSPLSFQRAFATNASALSRALHERLLRECPDSDEARHTSLWWSFPLPAETRWLPGDKPDFQFEVDIGAVFTGKNAERYEVWNQYSVFKRRLEEVARHAGEWEETKLLEALEAIRRDFLPLHVSANGSYLINHLDDLTLFLHEPGLTPAARAHYFKARLSTEPPDLTDPVLLPWIDFLSFLALVREPGGIDPLTRQETRRPMSVRMREFLKQFPRSRKREAALARLAIASVRETHIRTRAINSSWPEAPRPQGYKAMRIERGVAFHAQTVFEALDAYDREFPNGRYAAEIRLWRGAAFIDHGDFHRALALLVATLDDAAHRDLHLDAALNLADLFMRLPDEPAVRPGLLAGLRENASARRRLEQFMRSETPGARLLLIEDWLNTMLGRP